MTFFTLSYMDQCLCFEIHVPASAYCCPMNNEVLKYPHMRTTILDKEEFHPVTAPRFGLPCCSRESGFGGMTERCGDALMGQFQNQRNPAKLTQ